MVQTISVNPWDYLLPYAVNVFGPDVLNPEKRALWCKAIMFAGNSLCLWNKVPELKLALLSMAGIKPGQKVVVVAKQANESGLAPALRSLLDQDSGGLTVVEIGGQAFDSFSKVHPTTRKRMQWDFTCFDCLPDKSVDRVILFGAASHIGNLTDCVRSIHRVLSDTGRVVVADAPWGGRDLFAAAGMDAHLYGFVTRIVRGMGIEQGDLPEVGAEEVAAALSPLFPCNKSFSWRGLYTFCGQKQGADAPGLLGFPIRTDAVTEFLAEKAIQTPWDFLSDAEAAVLGLEVRDRKQQKNWGRAIFFGANLKWLWENTTTMTYLMHSNLRAKQGDRVLVVGEFLEELGFLPELRKRVGDRGEIAAFDIVHKSRAGYTAQWEKGPDVVIPEKHQWDYPFADTYPDDYFDVLWLPQGVHHAYNWDEIAPRLIRAVKPGGQVLMAECRVPAPEFHTGLKLSGLLECIVDKIFWGMDTTLDEMPDYPTAQIARAFGDSLTDVFQLEWSGWLLFWGMKRH